MRVMQVGGLATLGAGQLPWGVILMGIASNGGATAILLLTGQARKQKLLTAFFALITLGLVTSLVLSKAATTPLW
ncbi:MAG: hypothetical protein AAFX04_08735 [Pseudomonadota bacterium]